MNINLLGNFNATNNMDFIHSNNDVSENSIGVVKSQDIKLDISSDIKKHNENSLEKHENNDEIDKKELNKSLKRLNKFLEDDSAHAEYSVHEDLGTVMIKIVDDITKEVILEVPPKKILDMVASMCKQFGLIDKKV